MLPALGLMWLLVVVGAWLYEALMTSSSKQGTLGKMALGLTSFSEVLRATTDGDF